MDKFEILAKSLEENGIVDEREKQIGYRAGYFALLAIAIAWFALTVFKMATQQPIADTSFLLFVGMSAMAIYQYAQAHRKELLWASIAFCIATFIWGISYVMQVLSL